MAANTIAVRRPPGPRAYPCDGESVVCRALVSGLGVELTFSSLGVMRFPFRLRSSRLMPVALRFLCSRRIVTVQETENRGDEEQGRHCRAQQATNDRTAQRRILFAAVAEAERH